jgi:Uma2 family endonuclease
MRLSAYVEGHPIGEVLTGEVGIYIRHDPDTIRAADIAFISQERLARCKEEGYLDVAPEIVVEVLSPNDRRGELADKIEDYFSAGVDRVWVLESKQRRILVHGARGDVQQFQVGDVLTDEARLPGFRLTIADLFA